MAGLLQCPGHLHWPPGARGWHHHCLWGPRGRARTIICPPHSSPGKPFCALDCDSGVAGWVGRAERASGHGVLALRAARGGQRLLLSTLHEEEYELVSPSSVAVAELVAVFLEGLRERSVFAMALQDQKATGARARGGAAVQQGRCREDQETLRGSLGQSPPSPEPLSRRMGSLQLPGRAEGLWLGGGACWEGGQNLHLVIPHPPGKGTAISRYR